MSAMTGDNVEEAVTNFSYEIVKEKVRLIPMKDEYMMMLLSLNEDFDDDLLQDAIGMLVE